LLRRETVAAVDRASRSRLERHLGYAAALAARRFEQLAPASAAHAVSAAGSVRGAAIVAAARLVGKALLGKKSLLACGERKRTPAVATAQSFIGVH
jgi:hypothetical protein